MSQMQQLSAALWKALLYRNMRSKTICLSVFFVAIASLIFLNGSLASAVENSEPELSEELQFIDPTDMSQYYAMGEYYPPNEVNAFNIDWQGGRVEIVAYNGNDYYVEEASTRYLQENERLGYTLENQVFNVAFVGDESVVVDDAYKKLEIRIPKVLLPSLQSVNINTNGEVVMKNITAKQITVTGRNSDVRFTDTYSPNTTVSTVGGNVSLTVQNGVGYSVNFKSRKGVMDSYVKNGLNSYTTGDGKYVYSVNTKSGNFKVALDTGE